MLWTHDPEPLAVGACGGAVEVAEHRVTFNARLKVRSKCRLALDLDNKKE